MLSFSKCTYVVCRMQATCWSLANHVQIIIAHIFMEKIRPKKCQNSIARLIAPEGLSDHHSIDKIKQIYIYINAWCAYESLTNKISVFPHTY